MKSEALQAAIDELSAMDLPNVTGFRAELKRKELLVGLGPDRLGLQVQKETREFVEARRGEAEGPILQVLEKQVPGKWTVQWSKDDWGHFAEDGRGTVLIFSWSKK